MMNGSGPGDRNIYLHLLSLRWNTACNLLKRYGAKCFRPWWMGLALVTGTFYLHLLSLRWNTSCKLLLRDMVLNVSGHDKWDWPWWQEHLPWLIIIEVKYCLYITSKRYGAKCFCRLSCLCGLIYLLSNAFKLFGFPMLSVHDERYSRNVSSSLNLISTCLFVLTCL